LEAVEEYAFSPVSLIGRVMGRRNNSGACSSSMENSTLVSAPASSLDQLPLLLPAHQDLLADPFNNSHPLSVSGQL